MNWPTDSGRGRLAACLALALGVHGGVLALFAPGLRPGLPAGQRAGFAVVDLRVDSAAASRPLMAEAGRTALAPEPAVPEPAPPEPVITSAAPAVAADPTGEQRLPGPAGSDAYLPRRWLSVAPQALAPIVVAYPDDAPQARESSEARLVLSLYINELGGVDRTRIDEGRDLPAAFQAAAEQAFATARFHPGEIEAGVVKSLIRVEVVFHSGAAAPS